MCAINRFDDRIRVSDPPMAAKWRVPEADLRAAITRRRVPFQGCVLPAVGVECRAAGQRYSMLFHQIRCFMGVVREGTFGRAAQQLHVTQPALSYQIKQLESELDTSLFYRGPGGVSLTPAGRVLAERAGDLLRSVREARQAIDDISEEPLGEVRLGTVNSIGIHFLPEVLRSLADSHPGVRPTVLYRHSERIIQALVAGQIELAIVANPAGDRRLHEELLLEEPVPLVCSPSDPLFGQRQVEPSQLEGRPFVELFDENPTGLMIRDHLSSLGITVNPVVATDNVETIRRMIEVGLGIGFLPDMVLCDGPVGEQRPEMELSRACVGSPVVRRIVLVRGKWAEPSRAMLAMTEELRRHAQRWIGCAG